MVVLQTSPTPHAAHAAPAAPQEEFVSEAYGSHAPLEVQQPFGQDAELHTHCPVVVLQASPAGHAAHVAPPAPHDEFDSPDRASHVPVDVQQPAHDPPPHVQTPLEHVCPVLHARQAAPLVPHSLDDCPVYATQVLPLQQPLGHEVASHTHWPVALLHSCPEPQAAHAAPPVPQEALDSAAYASHVPVDVQQPFGHVLASHEHVPRVVSQRPFEQEVHAAPPVPHCEAVWEEYGTHVLPLQQPLGQEAALQTHCPVVVLHCWPEAHAAQAAPLAPHELFVSDA